MNSVIETIKERCKRCYTCVRECPAKAIRILDGQAEVIPERCIGCGNCYRVCTQDAKKIVNSEDNVRELLEGEEPVAAIVAPSFPAEFVDYAPLQFVAGLRKLGFSRVHEVAFGADLTSRAYRDLSASSDGEQCFIGTSCPAVYRYVEKYIPELVDNLAPIVSPMIATARVIAKHWPGTRVVFLGPCLAKKLEALDEDLENEVDDVLLFRELREMFEENGIEPSKLEPEDFDEPRGFLGTIYPIPRGSLRSAHLDDDPITCRIIEVNGRKNFPTALRSLANGSIDADLMEVLACEGCIMGPGMTNPEESFARRNRISNYAQSEVHTMDMRRWQRTLNKYGDIDLTRNFRRQDTRMKVPEESELRKILSRMGKESIRDELNCGACGYQTCREHAIAVYHGIAECEMCLPYSIEELEHTLSELELSHNSLREMQEQLVQSEKLASMGQLAAGIAHEVNNPLGTVLLYSNMLLEELQDKVEYRQDVKMVAKEAERCKNIISNLLDFARQRKVVAEKHDIEKLLEDTVSSLTVPDNIEVSKDYAPVGEAELDYSQMKQVFTNIVKNAFEAMENGGRLTIRTSHLDDDRIRIEFQDTGPGVDESVKDKVFNPFFTTKAIGKGTGLGLAVSYGIIKMHRGQIGVTNTDEGAQFFVELNKTLSDTHTPVGGQLWQES
ncbi:MAG: [Fe-Fe] hydrogenase large subunit C-terminal domain-containing protein [Planctomycetota bacterium]|nr:[Fe-Fe] hydrogenase large subunit C-terminal domain-containing protein [Planctomycetota bacterium]